MALLSEASAEDFKNRIALMKLQVVEIISVGAVNENLLCIRSDTLDFVRVF